MINKKQKRSLHDLLNMGRFLWTQFRKDSILMGCSMVASQLAGVLSLALLAPVIYLFLDPQQAPESHLIETMKQVISKLGLQDNLLGTMLLVAAAFVVAGIITFIDECFRMRVAARVEAKTRQTVLDSYIESEWTFISSRKAGEVENAVSSADRTGSTVRNFTTLCVAVVQITIYAAVALSVNPQAMLALLIIGAFCSLIPWLAHSRLTHLGERTKKSGRSYGSLLHETLHGTKFIKSAGLESYQKNRLADWVRDRLAIGYRRAFLLSVINSSQTLMALAVLAMVYFCVAHTDSSIGELMVFLAFAARIGNGAGQIRRTQNLLVTEYPNFEACQDFISAAKAAKEKSGPTAPTPDFKEIALRNIHVTLGGRAILRGVDLSFKKGQFIALVGPSGCGKSTLVDALTGLIKPSSGSISIDGVDLQTLDVKAWQNRLGIVAQESMIFNTSIAKNVSLERPSNADTLQAVLHAAHANEFLVHRPKGSDEVLNSKGYGLSGGERQRLALARALYRQPALLILDEATSALDNESERCIKETLAACKGQQTILAIAHRLTSIRDADIIHVIKDGRIVESGTYEELSTRPGPFAELLHAAQLDTF